MEIYQKIWNELNPDNSMPEEGFVIHHIDENRDNNIIDNLIKITTAEHNTIHHKSNI